MEEMEEMLLERILAAAAEADMGMVLMAILDDKRCVGS